MVFNPRGAQAAETSPMFEISRMERADGVFFA
jgi:hypothetical protein